MTSFVAAPAEITMLPVVAEVNPLELTVKVYVVALSNNKLLKVAIPFTAFADMVPLSVPVPVAIAIVTDADDVVTILPPASCIAATNDGDKAV